MNQHDPCPMVMCIQSPWTVPLKKLNLGTRLSLQTNCVVFYQVSYIFATYQDQLWKIIYLVSVNESKKI